MIQGLRLAAELSGTLLSGPGGSLLLVERTRAHALPTVAVLGREPADLNPALAAVDLLQGRGVDLNLVGLLALGCELGPALDLHRRRIGALVAALDAGLPWLAGKPMLPRRLPGRILRPAPVALEKAPMRPLEKAELKAFLPDWDKGRRTRTFRRPKWREVPGGGFETDLWSGIPLPEGAELQVPPLELPVATPLADTLRSALRQATGGPVPLLPLPEDPSGLHALRGLTPDVAAFRGPLQAWLLALQGLASLPGPPHFCARC